MARQDDCYQDDSITVAGRPASACPIRRFLTCDRSRGPRGNDTELT